MVVVPRAALSDAKPVSASEVAGAIAVGRYEVTMDEFRVYERDTLAPPILCALPLIQKYWTENDNLTRYHPGLGGYQPSGRDPAICVSWYEAADYVKWLSAKTGQQYRLPSAHELDLLASGDGATRYPWGNSSNDACDFANLLDRSVGKEEWVKNLSPRKVLSDCDDGFAYTAPVGTYRPNALGLYDIIGNVREWTSTCAHAETTAPSPTGDGDCPKYMMSPSGWLDDVDELRPSADPALPPNTHFPTVGLRVVRILPN
jgi:formylglycine-generating enzyme required for sulfatase activity